jgi:hypothetical protein
MKRRVDTWTVASLACGAALALFCPIGEAVTRTLDNKDPGADIGAGLVVLALVPAGLYSASRARSTSATQLFVGVSATVGGLVVLLACLSLTG